MRRKGLEGTRTRQSDVARLAGVSQGTVSLVINGRDAEGRIPAGTRDRVLEVARELRYVPDPAARRLAGGQNKLLGIFTFESVFPVSQHDFYQPFLVGIEERAEQRGYDLVLFTGATQPGGARGVFLGGQNRMGLADGSIILGRHMNKDDIIRLRDEGYPFTLLGRRDLPGEVSFVTATYREGTVRVFDELIIRGHRRVAYVSGDVDTEPARDRHAGLGDAQQKYGSILTVTMASTIDGVLSSPELDRMLQQNVTAIVCHFAETAQDLIESLRKRGIGVPDSVSVVTLNDPPSDNSELSGLRIPRREMGADAVDLLLAQIEGERGDLHRAHRILPTHFELGTVLGSALSGERNQ